jgi:hypothetical protein
MPDRDEKVRAEQVQTILGTKTGAKRVHLDDVAKGSLDEDLFDLVLQHWKREESKKPA